MKSVRCMCLISQWKNCGDIFWVAENLPFEVDVWHCSTCPFEPYFRGIFLLVRISADEVSIVQVNMELTEANMPGASSTCLLSVSCGSLLASRLGKCLLHMRRWFLMMSWRPSALIHSCHFGEGGAWTSCCLLLEYSYKQWMYLQTCCPPQPKQISFWFFQYKGLSTCI